jgi:hypothetical protein
MFDSSALGTLIIGLDSEASAWSETSVRRPARRSRATTTSAFRVRLASTLRSAADRLDRRPSSSLGASRSSA